jgi:hypothetical protein
MADSRDRTDSGGAAPGSSLLISAMAGAVLGAAGLAWWLVRETEKRRLSQRQQRLLRLSRLQGGARESDGNEPASLVSGEGSASRNHDGRLESRVQQLNLAIEEVRRQLEQLQTHP